ncbi:MAG TPA: sulfotransferase [Terriglobales bacterium]
MGLTKAPIFVVGCPRSGTTLLYHMLLSTGMFANYRAETHVFNVLVPRFGNLARLSQRTNLIDEWLKTDYFRATGLEANELRGRVIRDCHSGGDFLRIVMGAVAEQQGVNRWSECTPEHVLFLSEIKREIPEAKVIHIIRDGRDVAVSLERQGWIRPLAWDRTNSLLVAGLYWQYVVQEGRRLGRSIAPDYLEIQFERLVADPREELHAVSGFIEQPLDYDEILRKGIGSVTRPNSSFPLPGEGISFDPVGRWKQRSEPEIARLEKLIGTSLNAFGYDTQTHLEDNLQLRRMRIMYPALFRSKHWLKTKTLLGRLSDATVLHEPVLEDRD